MYIHGDESGQGGCSVTNVGTRAARAVAGRAAYLVRYIGALHDRRILGEIASHNQTGYFGASVINDDFDGVWFLNGPAVLCDDVPNDLLLLSVGRRHLTLVEHCELSSGR